ncbi:uncharacterized protein LOC132046784 [Lycium ferocissimum]|uniref:uncharacterized protein LOC132046784 n=1 Tax=Lycium ferocissimum TaxID=112874 RepID=UPI0028157CEB|nr:uncharacterized protein LOC132046784 [Lycium ferocissimum]
MEKLLNPYDKHCMKMAMLKHEEIFREQLYELHRLYQTQKSLMKNMSSSRPQQVKDHQVVNHHHINLDSNKKAPRQCIDLEIRPTDQEHIAESAGQDIEDDNHELELTLGLSSYNNRRRKTANFDSSPSFSSSNSTGSASSQIKHTTNLARNPRNDLNGHKWGVENLPVTNPSFQLGGRTQSNQNVEEQYRQDSLNNPPWLFQVLSLNMT